MNRAGVPDHFTMSYLPFEQDLNIIYSPLKASPPPPCPPSSLPSMSRNEAARKLVSSLDLDRERRSVKNPEKQLDPVQLKMQATLVSKGEKGDESNKARTTRLSGWTICCFQLPNLRNSNGAWQSSPALHHDSHITCSLSADLYGYGYLTSSQDDDSSHHDAVLDCKLAFSLPVPHSQLHRKPRSSEESANKDSMLLPGLLDHVAKGDEEEEEETIRTTAQYYSALQSLQRAGDTRAMPRIFRGLKNVVERLVTDGGDASFAEAAKCLREFRSACAGMMVEIGGGGSSGSSSSSTLTAPSSSLSLQQQQFNSFLSSLKGKYRTGFKKGFWKALQALGVSIISYDSRQVQVCPALSLSIAI